MIFWLKIVWVKTRKRTGGVRFTGLFGFLVIWNDLYVTGMLVGFRVAMPPYNRYRRCSELQQLVFCTFVLCGCRESDWTSVKAEYCVSHKMFSDPVEVRQAVV